MQRYKNMLAAAVMAAASSRAMAQTTYNIQRIGLTDAGNAPGQFVGVDSSGGHIEQNSLYYADASGVLIGAASEYNGTASPTYSAAWFFNGTATIQIGLTAANGSQYAKPATASASIVGQVNTSLYSGSFNATRIYNNGYVAGTSGRYDANANSMGADAWLFNGTTSSAIALPTLAAGGSNTTYAGNVSYSYVNPNTAAATYGDTIQSMGASSIVMPGGNGSATGAALLYYANPATSPTTYTAIGNGFSDNDAWYFNGTSTVQIGLISGNNVNSTATTGVTSGVTANTPFDRSSTPIEISSSGVVFGYSKYYGGSTALTTSNGQDLWIYDPNNATGTGANGTILVAPTSAPSGDSYTGGNSALAVPVFANNNGQFAAAFQMFANTDTARATALAQDAFVGTYSGGSVTWTQVGLTGSTYTFYQGIGTAANLKSGFGGSNIGTGGAPTSIGNNLYQYPSLNNAGQVVGYTKRTASNASSGGVYIGEDAWVAYPVGHVPAGAVAGTTQVGLTGGAYETTTVNGVNRASLALALSTISGAVAGVSQRYQTAGSGTATTVSTTAGQDAWFYDPAHGITATTQVGLTGPNYEFTPAGATNNFRSSTITALSNVGLIGGTSYRNPTGTSSSLTSGYDAWVYSAATHTTYNVDPYTASTTASSPNYVYSTISFISDTGVALGYDFSSPTNGSFPAYYDHLFEWYLAYDAGDGLYDTPTFQYLGTAVNAASFSAGNWSQLDTAGTVANYPSITASGNIVGLGGLSTENSSSYVPFLLTPASVPEPASLSLLGLGGLALLGRRRRRTA